MCVATPSPGFCARDVAFLHRANYGPREAPVAATTH